MKQIHKIPGKCLTTSCCLKKKIVFLYTFYLCSCLCHVFGLPHTNGKILHQNTLINDIQHDSQNKCWHCTFLETQFCRDSAVLTVCLDLGTKTHLFRVKKGSCFFLKIPGFVTPNMAGNSSDVSLKIPSLVATNTAGNSPHAQFETLSECPQIYPPKTHKSPKDCSNEPIC